MAATTLDDLKRDPYSLLRVGEAWRNRAGLVTLLATFVGFGVLLALGGASGSGAIAGLAALVGFVVLLLGMTAAGMQFMEQAAGRPVSGTLAVLAGSPMVLLRSLGLGLIVAVGVLAFVLVAALLLFLCKIPALGPVLYVVVLPALALVAGLGYLATLVVMMLAAPALWEGHSLKASLAQLWGVATQRPMEAFLQLVLLWLISSLVAGVIFGFAMLGFAFVAMLSAAILPGGGGAIGAMGAMGGMGGMMGGFPGIGAGMGSGGMLIAAGLGSAILFGIVGALVIAVFYLGLSLAYLKLTQGLDLAGAQAAMEAAMEKTREKAQRAAEEARRRAAEAQAAAQQRFNPPAAPLAAAPVAAAPVAAAAAPMTMPPAAAPANALACPACHASVSPDDVFCGHCGHRMK